MDSSNNCSCSSTMGPWSLRFKVSASVCVCVGSSKSITCHVPAWLCTWGLLLHRCESPKPETLVDALNDPVK